MNDRIPHFELEEWRASLAGVVRRYGREAAVQLLRSIISESSVEPGSGFHLAGPGFGPKNSKTERYPGDLALESKITNICRWNAAAMVLRANRKIDGIGGHLSTYASIADLFEVGFNHFFRGGAAAEKPDYVYFQGHASPGVYARSFLEGRFTETQLDRFRQEAFPDEGLSSYPHPWLMPDYWQFPTVSMGLSPIMAIYLARFLRYAEHRNLADTREQRVWAYIGDGEMDEPESRGALHVAAREGLSNLTFVVNCNLQRLDGPVRGNGNIIDELAGEFQGAGWRVIRLMWGSEWDKLFSGDAGPDLLNALEQLSDGELQKISALGGAYLREKIFEKHSLSSLADGLSDRDLASFRCGGHDPEKIYAAMQEAVSPAQSNEDLPVVILARTVKGYKLGEGIEARNITHQVKSMSSKQIRQLRDRLEIPVADRDLDDLPYWHPGRDSDICDYLHSRRQALGGDIPVRSYLKFHLKTPGVKEFSQALGGSDEKEVSTTMVFGRILQTLLQDKRLGDLVVPIIPDEARTFGLEPLFGRYKIYNPQGQTYEPVDAGNLIEYRESRKGQVLEEGISEAGAMSSFIAAGTAYANLNLPTIPFFAFYSMFGFQRIGDLIWAAMDARCRGFLIGATAGKTSLSGEGLQHQDGSSPLVASCFPAVKSFDPAYGYELAAIIKNGLEEMYTHDLPVIYYITVYNDRYPMPAAPADFKEEDILRGIHRVSPEVEGDPSESASILASGPMVPEAFAAVDILKEEFGVSAEVWSVTSWSTLARQAEDCVRSNLYNDPGGRMPLVSRLFGEHEGPVIGVSDYVKAVAGQIAEWMPTQYRALGADGFGRSDSTPALREFFGISARDIAFEVCRQLLGAGKISMSQLQAYAEKHKLVQKYKHKRGMEGVEYARGH